MFLGIIQTIISNYDLLSLATFFWELQKPLTPTVSMIYLGLKYFFENRRND